MAEQTTTGSTSVGEAYSKIADDNKKDEVAAEEIDTVWKASAYGDTDKLKEILEADGKLANSPDEAGRLPIQVSSGKDLYYPLRANSICKAAS
eukprot:5261943-Pyramimonas_sp.AAC.1